MPSQKSGMGYHRPSTNDVRVRFSATLQRYPARLSRREWGLPVLRKRTSSKSKTVTAIRVGLPVIAGFALLIQTTSQIAYQDTTSLLTAGVDTGDRWRVHMTAPPRSGKIVRNGGYRENTLRPKSSHNDYALRVPTDGNDLSDVMSLEHKISDVPLVTASIMAIPGQNAGLAKADRDEVGEHPDFPAVNRVAKSDFLISRYKSELIQRAKGAADPFERHESGLLDGSITPGQQSSFKAPAAASSSAATMLAMLPNSYSDFVSGDIPTTKTGTTMLASLPELKGPPDTNPLMPVVYAALLPTPNLTKKYQDAEEAIAALGTVPNGDNWKNGGSSAHKGVSFSSRQRHCLATAIYFEARGESANGQRAVAQVIVNRTQSKHWPNSICGVVYQNKKWRNRCQFSFACDGKSDKVRDRKSWKLAKGIADSFAAGYTMKSVQRATHYHASYVRPRWARFFRKLDKVGVHIFYRSRTGGWS